MRLLVVSIAVLAIAAASPDPVLASGDPYRRTAEARGGTLLRIHPAEQLAADSAYVQARLGRLAPTRLSSLLRRCRSVAEVVGKGPDLDAIFEAWRRSPSHWGIITNPGWTKMGAGQATGPEGQLYVSIIFCDERVFTRHRAPPPRSDGQVFLVSTPALVDFRETGGRPVYH